MAEETSSRANLFLYLFLAYVGSAFEFLWVLVGRGLRRLALVHAGFEVALAAWLVALTGGVESPFVFLLLVATVLSAVAAGSRGAFVAATLSSGALFVMGSGVPVFGLVTMHADSRQTAIILASGGGCFATAALASYLAERLLRTGRALSAREAELRALGEKYLKVAQSLRSGLMTLGPSRRPGDASVTLINEPGAAILGVGSASAQGRTLREVVPELAAALDVSQPGRARSECQVKIADGRMILLGFTLSPLRSEDGEPQGSVVTFQDLTEQRKLEETLRRQSHLASLGELAAGLAHEIRNPLAALSGAVQMLAPSAPTEDRKLFEVIQGETGHMESLLSDFLRFARPPAPALGYADLGELSGSIFDAFQASEQVAQRQLVASIRPVKARFDEGQMRQVIWNLLRNALEATGPEGVISLSVTEHNQRAVVMVDDDGPGIAADLRERIFEPFFTTKERGTGLGLALVVRIIAAHGGTIDVEALPRGTRFVVTLPGGEASAGMLV